MDIVGISRGKSISPSFHLFNRKQSGALTGEKRDHQENRCHSQPEPSPYLSALVLVLGLLFGFVVFRFHRCSLFSTEWWVLSKHSFNKIKRPTLIESDGLALQRGGRDDGS